MLTIQELNQKGKEMRENLQEHRYFDKLKSIDHGMVNMGDKFNKRFYMEKEDEASEILGEILGIYAELKSMFESYIVWRKTQLFVESETNKVGKDNFVTVNGRNIKFSRLAGFAMELAKSEVSELYATVIYLKYQIQRAENTVKTCRNHTYGVVESFKGKENE